MDDMLNIDQLPPWMYQLWVLSSVALVVIWLILDIGENLRHGHLFLFHTLVRLPAVCVFAFTWPLWVLLASGAAAIQRFSHT